MARARRRPDAGRLKLGSLDFGRQYRAMIIASVFPHEVSVSSFVTPPQSTYRLALGGALEMRLVRAVSHHKSVSICEWHVVLWVLHSTMLGCEVAVQDD